MVLKSVWKLPKLQAQTSQSEMTVHADERKSGGYVLIMNFPWIQIYTKYNPKFSFKSTQPRSQGLSSYRPLERAKRDKFDKAQRDTLLDKRGPLPGVFSCQISTWPDSTRVSLRSLQGAVRWETLGTRLKSTPLNLQTATPRVHFASTEG